MKLHNTQHCHTKIVEVEHTLKYQDAISGSAKGETYIIGGFPQIYKVFSQLLKINIVDRVYCGKNYIAVVVNQTHRWPEIEGLIQSVIVKHVT